MKLLLSFISLLCAYNLCLAQISSKILLKTTEGDITLGLYDATPKHKANFEKLVKEGFYDGLLFHRVMSDFMIQGGDPNSKDAEAGTQLGNGGPGYQIDAEIVDTLYHKKGALAAARQPDNVNPERKSSGSQFYIVQGKKFTEQELQQIEQQKAQSVKNQILQNLLSQPENAELRNRLQALSKVGNQKELNFTIQQITPAIEAEYEKLNLGYSEKAIETYTEIGGYAYLDGEYTIFGEVLDGLDVVDKIAAKKVDGKNRPNEDIKIIKAKIVK